MKPRVHTVRGFTLIEVVVAFSILALALGALYPAFAGALERQERAANLGYATLLAESVRDRAGLDLALDRDAQGQWDDCAWRLHGEAVASREVRNQLTVYQTRVSANCGAGAANREAVLDFIELATKP